MKKLLLTTSIILMPMMLLTSCIPNDEAPSETVLKALDNTLNKTKYQLALKNDIYCSYILSSTGPGIITNFETIEEKERCTAFEQSASEGKMRTKILIISPKDNWRFVIDSYTDYVKQEIYVSYQDAYWQDIVNLWVPSSTEYDSDVDYTKKTYGEWIDNEDNYAPDEIQLLKALKGDDVKITSKGNSTYYIESLKIDFSKEYIFRGEYYNLKEVNLSREAKDIYIYLKNGNIDHIDYHDVLHYNFSYDYEGEIHHVDETNEYNTTVTYNYDFDDSFVPNLIPLHIEGDGNENETYIEYGECIEFFDIEKAKLYYQDKECTIPVNTAIPITKETTIYKK